jgi:hypothetical protein
VFRRLITQRSRRAAWGSSKLRIVEVGQAVPVHGAGITFIGVSPANRLEITQVD